MVSSAIWKKACTSEFFKDDQNCTSPKDECNLKSLKNSRMYVFFKLHEKPYYYLSKLKIYKKPYYYLLMIYMSKLYIHLLTVIGHRHA